MGRWTNFLGSPKAITAATAQTLVWTGNDLPSDGVVGFHFAVLDAAAVTNVNELATCMTRLRIKADSTTIVDIPLAHFQAHQERFSQANFAAAPTNQAWSVWLNMFDIVDDDLADRCQFPRGTVPTVELTTSAAVVAGSAFCGWTQSDQPADYYPVLLSGPMNIPAGAVNQTFPISEPGMMRGYGLNTVGLQRVRLEISGFQYEYLPGVDYAPPTTAGNAGDMFRGTEQIENGTTFTDPIWHRLYMVEAGLGSSRIELSTRAAIWAGTANEFSYWAVRPQQ